MAKDPNAFVVNERVSHHVYGLGTISEIDHARTTINFDENGPRKFVTSMVRLEHRDVPAPTPPPKASRAKTAKAKAEK